MAVKRTVLRPSTRRSRCRISVSRAFGEDEGTQRLSLLSCLSRAEPWRQVVSASRSAILGSCLLRLFLLSSPICLLQTIFLRSVHISTLASHVTFPFTITLLFIITCRRGSSSSLSRTLTHYAYPLISDVVYDTAPRYGRPFPGLSCI